MKIVYPLIIALILVSCVTTKTKKEEFTVDPDSPRVEIGVIEAQFDRLFSIGGLRKANIAVFYFPHEDAVCLRYRSDLITYNQFWSGEGREAFINSLEMYKEDYSQRNLSSKGSRKAKQKYGIVQGYLVWQLHRLAVLANANMNVELGYSFYKKAPYFTVNQMEAEFISPIARDDNRTSQIITIFFTRAQAEELAALFDRKFLDGFAAPASRGITPGNQQR